MDSWAYWRHCAGKKRLKLLGGMSVKTTGGKTRVISAVARAKISQASKERWAKFRATKAKGQTVRSLILHSLYGFAQAYNENLIDDANENAYLSRQIEPGSLKTFTAQFDRAHRLSG